MRWTEGSKAFVELDVVDDQSETSDEQLGTKDKFWFEDVEGTRWLFKWCREKDGRVRGEDWAEVLVASIAGLMGVPTAEVRLAASNGRRGIVSKEVLRPEKGDRLVLGNGLLSLQDASYDPTAKRENARYTVEAVRRVLLGTLPPASCDTVLENGFDVWTGFLVLDALVAGRDRHHENRGVVSDGRARRSAPSFDHGNALGFQESDERFRYLATSDEAMSRWVERGRSHHFRGRPGLVQLAADAMQQVDEVVRLHWLEKVAGIDFHEVGKIVALVPDSRMSVEARTFVLEMLNRNQDLGSTEPKEARRRSSLHRAPRLCAPRMSWPRRPLT